mmetsp:Transcript_11079/g.18594  ORF Transcript_11079/g.18594 Transcript_11079/m.18594 type:complete len:156 (+) Transcript_11079:130-597(+)
MELVEVGKIALGEEHANDALFCFHVPPFNSIDHLHLHAIASPKRMSRMTRMKYSVDSYYCESAESAITILEQQDRDKIGTPGASDTILQADNGYSDDIPRSKASSRSISDFIMDNSTSTSSVDGTTHCGSSYNLNNRKSNNKPHGTAGGKWRSKI